MSQRVHVTGLISVAEGARRELSVPLSVARRDWLEVRVARALQQLEKVVREAGSRIDHLPAPTRRAAAFLGSIDWAKLPVAAEGSILTSERRVVLRGLQSFVERAMDRLAEPLVAAELETVRSSIDKMSRRIEGTIARQNAPARQLTAPARELRGWLAFFSRPENLIAYSAAQTLALAALHSAAQTQNRFVLPLRIHFRPMRGIYRVRGSRSGSIVSLPTQMIAFDGDAFASLGSMMFGRDRNARQKVVSEMAAEGFQTIYAELEMLSGIIEESRGAFFDLRESFDRVNARYFDGAMPKPRLTWSRSFTGRKFGHYDWVFDTVMVSRTLDSGDLPEFVVDFIVYHELLHKKHGLYWVNGRGYAHTQEFFREERRFRLYQESEALLTRLARGPGLRRQKLRRAAGVALA